MATATLRTKTVTEMKPVDVEVTDGVDLHLTEEEAFLVAVLTGCIGGGQEHPLRDASGSIWKALGDALGTMDQYGFKGITNRPEYQATKDAFVRRPSTTLHPGPAARISYKASAWQPRRNATGHFADAGYFEES